MKADRDTVKAEIDKLKQFAQGSPSYKQQEERVATMQSQLQVKVNLQKRDFMEKEAKIYHQVYQEIQREVAYFGQRHGIGLVLRYNSTPIDPNDRQSVLAGVNKAVVFQNNIDITFDILDRLNPRTSQNTGGGPAPARGGLIPGQPRR